MGYSTLARHLTERDRDILVRLYDVQVLTTDQLAVVVLHIATSLPGPAAVPLSPQVGRSVLSAVTVRVR